MANHDDFFTKMCREATDELASGEVGWKSAEPNTLILACFGMLMNHPGTRIVKPLWFFAGTMFAGVVGYFILQVLGG